MLFVTVFFSQCNDEAIFLHLNMMLACYPILCMMCSVTREHVCMGCVQLRTKNRQKTRPLEKLNAHFYQLSHYCSATDWKEIVHSEPFCTNNTMLKFCKLHKFKTSSSKRSDLGESESVQETLLSFVRQYSTRFRRGSRANNGVKSSRFQNLSSTSR